jgi:hypothetical protein
MRRDPPRYRQIRRLTGSVPVATTRPPADAREADPETARLCEQMRLPRLADYYNGRTRGGGHAPDRRAETV